MLLISFTVFIGTTLLTNRHQILISLAFLKLCLFPADVIAPVMSTYNKKEVSIESFLLEREHSSLYMQQAHLERPIYLVSAPKETQKQIYDLSKKLFQYFKVQPILIMTSCTFSHLQSHNCYKMTNFRILRGQ